MAVQNPPYSGCIEPAMLSSRLYPFKVFRPLRALGRLCLGLLFCLGALSGALAAEGRPEDRSRNMQTLRDALFGGHRDDDRTLNAPIIARFASDDGDSFVLDRSQALPLIRFDDHREIWVLAPSRAARGDMIYKNDAGRPVLRATQTGGLTLFTLKRPAGAAVALEGKAPPVRLIVGPMSPNTLLQRLAQASARASRAAQKLITFDAEDVTPESSYLYADTAAVAADAVVQLSKRPDNRDLLANIGRVRLIEGRRVDVRQQGQDLRITIVIDDGLAGRPSSERIVKALDR
ncbi:MAG: hypothetical protein RLZZ141_320 [Pseudomonadota bacterium]